MATLTTPFCLEMLTFCHPERALAHFRNAAVRGEGLWPLSQCLFAWKCLHFATQRELWHTSETQLYAGRAYGHSHNAFLLGNAYILPPRESSGTLQKRSCTRGGLMATLTVPFCLEMLTFCHPERTLAHFRN